MQSAYDSTDVDGKEFTYAGNSFPRAPQHSFSTGFSVKTRIVQGIHLFATPWYYWQSYFWFTEANSLGLDQSAYGILNIKAGIELVNPDLIISILGTNMLDEKYYSSSGHWGGIFGMPTVVRGTPRMLKAGVTWNF
jgi:hypothetical protein